MSCESGASAGHARILIAEHHQPTLGLLAAPLRRAGYEVIEALDSGGALDSCLQLEPHLALISHELPDGRGLDLLRMLGGQRRVSLLFMLSDPDAEVIDAATDAGAVACLSKPLTPVQVLRAVRTTLRRDRELRALRAQVAKLDQALQSTRAVNVATGLLMGRQGVSQQAAFESLRQYARSQRLRLEEVANQLLRTVEEADLLFDAVLKGTPPLRLIPREARPEQPAKIASLRRQAG